jgi:hypothetical protein
MPWQECFTRHLKHCLQQWAGAYPARSDLLLDHAPSDRRKIFFRHAIHPDSKINLTFYDLLTGTQLVLPTERCGWYQPR